MEHEDVQPINQIDGTIKIKEDEGVDAGEEKTVDFGTWFFREIKKKISADRDDQDEEWRFQWEQPGSNLYLWTVEQVEDRAATLHNGNTKEADDYFQNSEHLHLINRNTYVPIVFTNKKEVRESDFGDRDARKASRAEAKAASSVKHHQGGFSDETSYYLANRIPQAIQDAPKWQIDLVRQLQDKFVYQRLMKNQELCKVWLDQWKDYLTKK